MKKNVAALVFLTIALLSGCVESIVPPVSELCTVEISFGLPIAAKSTIFPDAGDTTVVSYELDGEGPAAQSESWSGAATSVTLDQVLPGSWTFTVLGLNAAGNVVSSGSDTVELFSGADNALSITLTLASGTGSLIIDVYWPGTTLADPGASGVLKKLADDTDTALSFVVATDPTASANEPSLDSGPYLLTLYLLDGVATIASTTRVVWMYPGTETAALIDLLVADIKSPPVPPDDLSLENVDSDTIRLNWTDKSNTELGYKIFRSTGTPDEIRRDRRYRTKLCFIYR